MATAIKGFTPIPEGATSLASLNEELIWLEVLRGHEIQDRTLTAPPGGESAWDLFIPAATATGDWAGQEGNYALFFPDGVGYKFRTPTASDGEFLDLDTSERVYFDGTTWRETADNTTAT